FLICVLVPRSTSSTLFPYTTLFRSQSFVLQLRLQAQESLVQIAHAGAAHAVGLQLVVAAGFVQGHARAHLDLVARARHEPHLGRDRKSTRLNSSHVKISYAVFCLKK